MKTLKIRDYTGKRFDTGVDISDEGLKNIFRIDLKVITGDDVVTVEYEDHTEEYDASDYSEFKRRTDYYDGSDVLYDKYRSINDLDNYLSDEDDNPDEDIF